MEKKFKWDVIIIGGGASGLMAAIQCGRKQLKTLVLERNKTAGMKILMSGGGRANITNRSATEEDYGTESKKVVRHVLKAFSTQDAADFFNQIGVELKEEEGGKLFARSEKSRTVLEALIKEAEKANVLFRFSAKVEFVRSEGSGFKVSGNVFEYFSKTIVITTGGLSYPTTGSEGTGHEMAKSLGHHLIPTTPALVPFVSDDPPWRKLSGLSLPVRLSLFVDGKKSRMCEGSFLFTHFGFSGPVVLDMSRHWLDAREKGRGPEIIVNFLPADGEEKFKELLAAEREKNPGQFLKTCLRERLPERFVEAFLEKIGVPASVTLNQLKTQDRDCLLRSLFQFFLTIDKTMGYEKAEVTRGGVDLGEVDSGTLESRLVPGLFFAGEILDADGRVGGFNLQWAWSSAVVAARGVAKRVFGF